MGYRVRLYDVFPATVEAINAQGGIIVDGVVEGFGKPELVTLDIGEAIRGADAVMVVAPATAHKAIAKNCAPHLTDGQILIIHPGATFGSLEFRHVLEEEGCTAEVAIAETNSLIYACRSLKPGHASILGIKDDLIVATLPARENARALGLLQEAFPQIVGGKNVIETSLGNANAVMHPTPTLLNTSLIESRHEWLYYWEGITPTIGAFVEEVDRERVELGKAFDIEITPIREWYAKAYGAKADTLSEAVRRNPAYEKIKGQKDLRTRYLLEDIPTGLIPMIELGRLAGLPMERMKLIARLGEYILGEDFAAKGRTLANLGLGGITGKQFEHFLETGEKPA
jgi:opine dehydrogenase